MKSLDCSRSRNGLAHFFVRNSSCLSGSRRLHLALIALSAARWTTCTSQRCAGACMAYVVWFYFACQIAPLLYAAVRRNSIAVDAKTLLNAGSGAVDRNARDRSPQLCCRLSLLLEHYAPRGSSNLGLFIACLVICRPPSALRSTSTFRAKRPFRLFPGHAGWIAVSVESNRGRLGSSVYDVFKSTHLIVALLHSTGVTVDADAGSKAFPCAVGLSTVYLRYHYAVDLVFGLGLFGLFWLCRQWTARSPACWIRRGVVSSAVAQSALISVDS